MKVLADKETDEILGVHMIGPRIANLIAEAVTAIEFRASAGDVARMSHAPPHLRRSYEESLLGRSARKTIQMEGCRESHATRLFENLKSYVFCTNLNPYLVT